MKKIINTFKYGASDVKRVLVATIFSGLVTLGLFIAAFITSIMVCFFGGIVMFFITTALAQTMGIKEDYYGKTIIPESSMYENVMAENSMPINHVGEESGVSESHMEYANPTENMMPESKAPFESMESVPEPEIPYEPMIENYEPYGEQIPETPYFENPMPYAEPANEAVMEPEEEKPKKKRKKSKKEKKKKAEVEEVADNIETIEDTENTEIAENLENVEIASDIVSIENTEIVENIESTESVENTIEAEEKKTKRKKKPKKTKQKEEIPDDEPQVVEAQNEEEEIAEFADDITFDEKETETGGITEEIVKEYNKKKIKKTLHKYKVKRDHRMVMVDHCDKLNIWQTPAYIWTDKNVFSLLLIEKEPRLITFPLFSLNQITYLKKQPANEYAEYAVFRSAGGMLVDLFRPYLPEYTHSTVVNDMTAYKNLYCIGPGIYFTNTSAANLFDLLPAEFVVKDKVTESNKVNVYFKEAYKANIKLRDNVLDAKGYADSISSVLENLAKSTISYNEFKETLNLLIKNKLITQEFAMHYMDVRDKMKG